MLKIQITAIKPSTPPRPYGGTNSLIPPYLAADGDRPVDITIIIDTHIPDRQVKTIYAGVDKDLITDWLPGQYGMHGKRVGDDATPLDIMAALTAATWLEWGVTEGKQILNLPVPELPEGAIA